MRRDVIPPDHENLLALLAGIRNWRRVGLLRLLDGICGPDMAPEVRARLRIEA
jgi:hypothetical protein